MLSQWFYGWGHTVSVVKYLGANIIIVWWLFEHNGYGYQVYAYEHSLYASQDAKPEVNLGSWGKAEQSSSVTEEVDQWKAEVF